MIAFDEDKSAQNDYFCIIMEIKHIFSVCLLAALGVAAAYGQVANTEEDEEPIDLELVRKPVRRPGHPVITYIKVLVGDEKAKRYVEVKPQPKEKSESNILSGNKATVAEMNKRSHQTQEEVEANVEKFLAEARAKAPKHETYVPEFATRRMHDEEKMTQQQLLASFNAKKGVGITKYLPKSAPSMVEQNAIYLYFEVPIGRRPGPMNIRVQYYADDRLDTQGVEFQINGEKYVLTPNKLNTKREGKYVSEWFDMPLTGDNERLVEAMGYANYVRVKFLGKSCNHIKDLTRDQVAQLRKAYFLRKIYR